MQQYLHPTQQICLESHLQSEIGNQQIILW